MVAHRVCRCTTAGLVTQGDASGSPDGELVGAGQLIGCVRFGQRGRRLYRVLGGSAGRLWVALLRLWRRAAPVAGRPYRWLRSAGLLRRIVQPTLSQVRLETDRGLLVKYIHRGRTVACWWPEERRFWCCKPYDLFLEPPAQPSE